LYVTFLFPSCWYSGIINSLINANLGSIWKRNALMKKCSELMGVLW